MLVQRRGTSVEEVRAALPRGPELRRAGAGALLVAAAAALLLAPELSRIPDFVRQLGSSPSETGAIGAGNLGNLTGEVSSFEAFGLWPSSDFRFAPHPPFWKYLLGGIGLAVTVAGSAWCLRRGRLLLPSAAIASAAIYLVLEARESVYIAAKGLAILAPFAILPAVLWLLTPGGRRKTAAAAAFAAVALYSSFLALTGASVGPRESGDELATLGPVVADSTVLGLVNDDYLRWELRGASTVTGLYYFAPRPEKRFTDGTAADIDVAPADVINRHRYVLTTNTPYASTPPAALKVVRRTRLYTLWRRDGRVPERRTLVEGGAPGAPLDCTTPAGRAIAAKRGWAVVVPRPVELRLEGPQRFAGEDAPRVSIGLPPGRWDLSLQYTSSHPVEVRGGGLSGELPAVIDRAGSFRVAGDVTKRTAGPLGLTLRVDDPSPLPTVTRGAISERLAATRAGGRPRAVPLSRACGLLRGLVHAGPVAAPPRGLTQLAFPDAVDVCTIIAKNYAPYARVLARSHSRAPPGVAVLRAGDRRHRGLHRPRRGAVRAGHDPRDRHRALRPDGGALQRARAVDRREAVAAQAPAQRAGRRAARLPRSRHPDLRPADRDRRAAARATSSS